MSDKLPYIISADTEYLMNVWGEHNNLKVPDSGFFTDFQAGCVEHIANASSFSGNDFEPIVIPHDKLASELQGLVSRYRQEGVVALDRAYIGDSIARLSRTKQMLRTLNASRQTVARRTGMSFVAIALVLQSFVLVMGTQAQASSDDMISGGVGSKEQILAHYDANTNNFRDVMTYNGITRAELAGISAMKRFTVDSSSYSWGWTPRFSEAQGQRAHSVAGRTVYSRPHSLWDFSWYNGWEGKSAARGTFRIVSACGNLVTYSVPTPPAPKPTPKPQPAVTCDSLTVTPIQGSRTKVRISGKASGQNGGVVKELRYYVFDANGNTIIQASAPGAESSTTIELPDAAGTYKAQVYYMAQIKQNY